MQQAPVSSILQQELPAAATVALSVVIPLFNEQDTVPQLYQRLVAVLEECGRSWEIVLVDDGSRDATFAAIDRICQRDSRVRAFRFSRNFGHHVAITAGLDQARGEYVVLMDGDLQHRPEEIPRFIQTLEDGGYDVVAGVREVASQPLLKRMGSAAFNRVMRAIMREQVQFDSNIYRIMRRKVVRSFLSCRERSRFVTGLFGWVGFKRGEMTIDLDPRFAGKSTYSLRRMLGLATNSITGFSYFPLQLSSYAGFVISLLSFAYGFYLIWRKVVLNTAVEGWTSINCTIFFVGGIQMMMLGVLGSYLGRIYTEVQNRPLYVVDESRNTEEAAS